MEKNTSGVEDLFEKLKEYAEVRVNLFKLKSIDKISGFTATLMTSLILVILLCGVLICITIGLALLIGMLLGQAYLGFFIMGGVYIIIGLVFYTQREKLLKTPVSNKLIKELVD